LSEHALYLMPRSSRSLRSWGSSWLLRLIFSAAIPAAIARRHSKPEDASMCMPARSKVCRIAAFGQAFIA
jgi:hypothetical protein